MFLVSCLDLGPPVVLAVLSAGPNAFLLPFKEAGTDQESHCKWPLGFEQGPALSMLSPSNGGSEWEPCSSEKLFSALGETLAVLRLCPEACKQIKPLPAIPVA